MTTLKLRNPRTRTKIREFLGTWPPKVKDCGNHELFISTRTEEIPGVITTTKECFHCDVTVKQTVALYD